MKNKSKERLIITLILAVNNYEDDYYSYNVLFRMIHVLLDNGYIRKGKTWVSRKRLSKSVQKRCDMETKNYIKEKRARWDKLVEECN